MKRPALACALAAGVLAASCNGQDGWNWERMVVQPRYQAYDANPAFADGRAMRLPPAGTVVHEALDEDATASPLPPGWTTGIAGGRELDDIPLPVEAAVLERGRDRFERFCAACHGRDGRAESPVARSMTLRPPPSLHLASIRAYSAGRLFRIASEGYGLMPSYAALLGVADRWAVVAYVQALQLSRHVVVDRLASADAELVRQRLDGRGRP